MSRLRVLLGTLLVAVVASACATGTSTSGFSMVGDPVPGVRSRCADRDSSCIDEARELGRRVLDSLGDPFEGEVGMRPDGVPTRTGILITYDWDPAVPWKATNADGQRLEGRTKRLNIDLGPLVTGEDAYAAVDAAVGIGYFVLPRDLATELFDALYVRE